MAREFAPPELGVFDCDTLDEGTGAGMLASHVWAGRDSEYDNPAERVTRTFLLVKKKSSVPVVSNATSACLRMDLATAWSVGWPHAHTFHLSRQQQCGMNDWERKATTASANSPPPTRLPG